MLWRLCRGGPVIPESRLVVSIRALGARHHETMGARPERLPALVRPFFFKDCDFTPHGGGRDRYGGWNAGGAPAAGRSEERRVGNVGDITLRYGGSPYNEK